MSVYDTGEHRISGFSQQQSGDQSLTFTSQFGLVRVADLPLVASGGPNLQESPAAPVSEPEQPQYVQAPAAPSPPAPFAADPAPPPPTPTSPDGILTTIERLSDLRQKNILTEAEFASKKAELLSRL